MGVTEINFCCSSFVCGKCYGWALHNARKIKKEKNKRIYLQKLKLGQPSCRISLYSNILRLRWLKILRRRIRKEEGNEMKFETTEFHCCPAVSRNYGGKTKEIIIIINNRR